MFLPRLLIIRGSYCLYFSIHLRDFISKHHLDTHYSIFFYEYAKHFKIDCYFIHHRLSLDTISFSFVSLVMQLVDFTKSHIIDHFHYLLGKLLMLNSITYHEFDKDVIYYCILCTMFSKVVLTFSSFKVLSFSPLYFHIV